MEVIAVDFTKGKRSMVPERVSLTINITDLQTSKELSIYVPLSLLRCDGDINAIIGTLSESIMFATWEAASMLYNGGLSRGRTVEEIASHLMVHGSYIGIPHSPFELVKFRVSGLRLNGEVMSPDQRFIYAVDEIDAHLQVRLECAEEMGFLLDEDPDRTCELMMLMTCEDVHRL